MPKPKSQKVLAEPSSQQPAPPPWQVPVAPDEVAENGRHFDLVADQDVRAAVAQVVGLRELPRLEATFDVTRSGATGLHVIGHVSATVGQTCVVTLEPLVNEIEEDIDLQFAPPPPSLEGTADDDDDEDSRKPERNWKDPEPLVRGVVDLGALATEFLILGLDPYPRKPGAVFESPQDLKRDPGPFAALAKLAKDGNGR
jgi:Large ribosomal RNA subunit accumulation protein YceD